MWWSPPAALAVYYCQHGLQYLFASSPQDLFSSCLLSGFHICRYGSVSLNYISILLREVFIRPIRVVDAEFIWVWRSTLILKVKTSGNSLFFLFLLIHAHWKFCTKPNWWNSACAVPISIYVFTLPLPYLGVASSLPTGFLAGAIILIMGLLIYTWTPSNGSSNSSLAAPT